MKKILKKIIEIFIPKKITVMLPNGFDEYGYLKHRYVKINKRKYKKIIRDLMSRR